MERAVSVMENPFLGVDVYETASGPRPGLLRRAAPSLFFYRSVFMIVYGSNRLAVKGLYGAEEWAAYSLKVVKALEEAGVKIRVEGLSRVDSVGGPAVIAANHMSTLETFVLPGLLRPRGPLTFVVKEPLLNYPLFGAVLRSCNPIPVGRKNPREDLAMVMGEGMRRLSEGSTVVVFPQTTRMDGFVPEKFNSIGAKLAARAGVPLIPLALRTGAWGTGRFLKDFGPVHPSLPVTMTFGEPLPPEGKGDRAHRACLEFIQGKFREWNGGKN